MNTEYRYQSGHPTGAVLRLGSVTRGTELRYIPGGGHPVEGGECFPLVFRTPFPVSQIEETVTGYETTSWTNELPSYFWFDGTSVLSLPNFGDAIGLNGLRFQCDETLAADFMRTTFSDSIHIDVTQFTPASQPYEQYINGTRISAGRYSLSTPFSSLLTPHERYKAAMHGGAYPEVSHVRPASVRTINVPMPFQNAYLSTRNGGLPRTNTHLVLHVDADPHGTYITHARLVINDEVAGPLTELGPGTRTKTERHAGVTYTFEVIGLQVGGKDRNSNLRNLLRPETFALPLFADRQIKPGDVVGFDMWVRIVREKYGFQPVGGAPQTYPGPGVGSFGYRPRWPPSIANVHKHSIYAYQGEASRDFQALFAVDWSEHVKKDKAWWVLGNCADNYNSTRHTYQLDFGAGFEAFWTPTDAQLFTFEDAPQITVSNDDCRVYVNSVRKNNSFEFGMDWNGETCAMIFFPHGQLQHDIAVQVAVNGQKYNILEVGYYPQESSDAGWVSAYNTTQQNPDSIFGIQSLPAGKAGRAGPFDQAGTTTFELAYLKFQGRHPTTGNGTYVVTVFQQYTTLLGGSTVPAIGPLARIPESITATRVNQ